MHLQFFVFEFVPPTIWYLHRRMRGVIWQISKKWLATLAGDRFFDEFHGLVREVINHESITTYDFSVVL